MGKESMGGEETCYLAVDLGAESGRVVAGLYEEDRLRLEEVHRFPNVARRDSGHLRWDIEGLFEGICAGLKKAGNRYGAKIHSLGVDAWGVDYGLVDEAGTLLGAPVAYRDERTAGVMERVFQIVPKKDIYEATGIQFLPFNTLFQLMAEKESPKSELGRAAKLLFIPDLINYWLSGKFGNEFTIASTSQCMEVRSGKWDFNLMSRLGIPTRLFSDPTPPGTYLGLLKKDIASRTGLRGVRVIAVAAHDTGSAIAAIPAEGNSWAYLSSGTWSLLGVECDRPIISDMSFDYNFTNEGGVFGTLRVLTSIAGLWIIQECRRHWSEEGEDLDYAKLVELAAEAPPFTALIDSDFSEFANPGDMPEKIRQYCEKTGQVPPVSKGSLARTIFEGLAMKYRFALERLKEIYDGKLDTLHIVGGGSQNRLLNQMTADAAGITVLAGPVEATSLGNILMQLIACGKCSDLGQGRALIGRSFPLERFEPVNHKAWNEPYERFKNILKI